LSRLLLVGVSYKNGALPERERLAALAHARVYEELKRQEVREAVVLSTCNRFEIYLVDERAEEWAAGILEKLGGADLKESLYSRRDAAAVEHLFGVASGLDSLVVGESEILGQVKAAYETAKASGMTGKRTNVLFQRALYTGKKVRNDTSIAVGPTSVATVAVQLAESIFGPLTKSEVLVLGAGQMAELTARYLLSKKVAKLTIANRTWERGKALADSLEAQAVSWESFERQLDTADVVIASTGSDKPVLRREAVAAAMARRDGRSLFLIDIAMPRDVEETVHGLEHVYLYRLEDLETIVAKNLAGRGGEVAKAKSLARAKAGELWKWLESLAAGKEVSLRHSDAEVGALDA
jgi:glutamyl-tRNA reductase